MKDKLRIICNDWESKLEKDEWYFSNAFEELVENLTPPEAFHHIPDVVQSLFTTTDCFLIGEMIDFLHTLYNKANTTEIHPYLHTYWDIFDEHIQTYADTYGMNAYAEWKALVMLHKK